ncbi:unnamed protein product [Withania somnifera]
MNYEGAIVLVKFVTCLILYTVGTSYNMQWVGDKMARLKGRKLQLPDVMRYGIELTKVIQELHSMNVLILNLKPTNFLLNEHDEVFLGDFGIPYLLLGVQPPDSDQALRLGTPNYMAPEQWEPEVRGPITCETDAWGFGCSIIEMLTGVPPWFGKSVQDIYRLVVINQEKPQLPGGLPTAIENVLNSCFGYDLCNRPLMMDILQAFESSKNAVYSEEKWSDIGGTRFDKNKTRGFTTWYLSKDLLEVGDTIRSRKERTFFRSTKGLGEFVQLKSNVKTPRFEWPQKRGGEWATGRISQIPPNGCLIVQFPGRMVFGDGPNTFFADPDEVIQVSFDTCPTIIDKYQHLEDFHWSIRPLSIAFSLFTAVKLGVSVGKCINAKLKDSKDQKTPSDGRTQDGQAGGKSSWLRPTVAKILFKEGAATATAR